MKIIIFDMDGTLIDSKKDITESINYVRENNHSLAPLEEPFVVEAINMAERNLPKMFYETELYLDTDRELFEKHYEKQCVKSVYLYEGIYETLQSLKKEGIKLSVATNAPTQFANLMLKSLKISDLFDVIIGADKVNASKPSPEMLHTILKHYNYNAKTDKAWMIGDNSKDMLSAKNAKIDSFFATWGFSKKSNYLNTLHSPKDILEIVL